MKIPKRDKNNNFIKNGKDEIKYEKLDLFDASLQKEAYESIGIIDKSKQVKIDAFKMKYRKVNGKWQTVGEFINKDWYLPPDEIQRPAGVFL